MAELSTPSAVAMFDAGADSKRPEKPDKPDEAAYQTKLAQAEKEHTDAKAKFQIIKDKVNNAQPNKNKDTPSNKRRQDIITQLKEIREKQASGKGGRTQIFDQIKKLDEQLKSRIAEQKTARSRVSFKNVDEIDREIDRLDKQVNGGMMKLVDEKKALAEISSLRKQRKNFAGFEESQKGIDDTKAKIKNLKDSLDDPEAKALGEKYNKLQTELDGIKAEQDEAYKNINSLRDEREKLYKLQQDKYDAKKKVQDEHWEQKKAFQQYEFQARQKTRERQKAEQEAYQREKRRERADRLLAEARDPAFMDEIRRAESLLHYLDPGAYSAPAAPLQKPSGLAAAAQRTVDASDLKGTRVVRKDEKEDSYFMGTGGKKGKKGRKAAAAGESPAPTTPVAGKFSCPPSVMEDCSAMGIEPPMSAADIPAITEKVKEKLAHWKADQKAETERNVAKAQKEIEKLDAEDEAAEAPKSNGNSKKETTSVVEAVANEAEKVKSAVSDIVADLQGASIDEKKED